MNGKQLKSLFAILIVVGFAATAFLSSDSVSNLRAGALFSWLEEEPPAVNLDSQLLDPEDFNLPATAKEIPKKRTAQTATFEIAPGKYAAVGVPDYLFAKNEAGKWVMASDIGRKESSFFVFDRLKGGVKASFDLNYPRFILEKNGYWLVFSFGAPAKGMIKDSHTVAYRLSDYIDLKWKVEGSRISKEIKISAPGPLDKLAFFVSKSEGLTEEMDNGRLIYKDENGRTVFATEVPVLTDAEKNKLDIPIKITKQEDWFYYDYSDKNLIFPYIIDPSVAGPNSPGLVDGGSAPAWTNPNGAKAFNDGSEASVTLPSGPSYSDALTATSFGFSIPAGATIDGVIVEVRKKSNGTEMYDNYVNLVGVGSVADKSDANPWGTSYAYTTYGSSADKWGANDLTPSSVNSSNFGVSFEADNEDPVNQDSAYVDHIKITIYYTSASGGGESITDPNPGGGEAAEVRAKGRPFENTDVEQTGKKSGIWFFPSPSEVSGIVSFPFNGALTEPLAAKMPLLALAAVPIPSETKKGKIDLKIQVKGPDDSSFAPIYQSPHLILFNILPYYKADDLPADQLAEVLGIEGLEGGRGRYSGDGGESEEGKFTNSSNIESGQMFLMAFTAKFLQRGKYRFQVYDNVTQKVIADLGEVIFGEVNLAEFAQQLGVPEKVVAVEKAEDKQARERSRNFWARVKEAEGITIKAAKEARSSLLSYSHKVISSKNKEWFVGTKDKPVNIIAKNMTADTGVFGDLLVNGRFQIGRASIGFDEDRLILGPRRAGIVFGEGQNSSFSFFDAADKDDVHGRKELVTITDQGDTANLWVSGGLQIGKGLQIGNTEIKEIRSTEGIPDKKSLSLGGALAIGRDDAYFKSGLHIVSTGQSIFDSFADNGIGAGVNYRKARGSPAAPASLKVGDVLGIVQSRGWKGATKEYRSTGEVVPNMEGFGPVPDANVRSVVDSVNPGITEDLPNTSIIKREAVTYGTRWEFRNRDGTGAVNNNLVIKETGDIGIRKGTHINWIVDSLNPIYGDDGYGLRDNDGTLQFKNAGGSWTDLSGANGGSLPSGVLGQILRHNGTDWTATSTLFINNNGNVGIGTTSPAEKLDIAGNIKLEGEEINFGGFGRISVPDNKTLFLQRQNLANLIISEGIEFRTGGVNPANERMRITKEGRVGIGTTSPTAKLEVAGQIKITGGSPGSDKILVSDANGLANWKKIEDLIDLPAVHNPVTLAGEDYLSLSGQAISVGKINIIDHTTGTLPETRGGTNQTSYAKGDILYASAANTLSKLAIGAEGKYLKVVNGVPVWADSAGGDNPGELPNKNTAIGKDALASLDMSNSTQGVGNSAFGYRALYRNTTGNYNLAIGYQALYSNTIGYTNLALGWLALFFNTSGSNNVAIGYQAGQYQANGTTPLTDPESSIYIGYNVKGKDNNDNNAIVIGYNAVGLGPNTVVLGNDSIVTTALKGKVGIGTTQPGGLLGLKDANTYLDVDANGNLTFTDAVSGTKTLADLVGNGGGSSLWLDGGSAGTRNGVPWGRVYTENNFVGIGTSTPGYHLSIYDATNPRIRLQTVPNASPTFGQFWDLRMDSSSKAFSISDNGSFRFVIADGGNVGIGITSPTKKLDVAGDINFTGDLYKNGQLVDLSGNSNPMTAIGDIIIGGNGGVMERLAKGQAGQVLTIGADGNPAWQDPAQNGSAIKIASFEVEFDVYNDDNNPDYITIDLSKAPLKASASNHASLLPGGKLSKPFDVGGSIFVNIGVISSRLRTKYINAVVLPTVRYTVVSGNKLKIYLEKENWVGSGEPPFGKVKINVMAIKHFVQFQSTLLGPARLLKPGFPNLSPI